MMIANCCILDPYDYIFHTNRKEYLDCPMLIECFVFVSDPSSNLEII